jgi:hypothetical protein
MYHLAKNPDAAEYRESEQRQHEHGHRHRHRGTHRPEAGVALDVEVRLAGVAERDDDAERPQSGKSVGEEVEERRRSAERVADHQRHEDVSAVRDA